MTSSKALYITLSGIVSGIFLAILLLYADTKTGAPLSRVLLGVSFLPGLAQYHPWPVEWGIHLLTSVIIAFLYAWVFHRFLKPNPLSSALFGVVISLIYFILMPMTEPQLRTVPSAYGWWLLCHILYGESLYLFFRKPKLP